MIIRFLQILFFFIIASSKAMATTVPSYSYSEMYMYDNQDDNNECDHNVSDDLIPDPFYIINKNIFNINLLIDNAFISPATEIYIFVVPAPARNRVGNFMSNLGDPINFFNLLLQGKFKQANISLTRFTTNTVLGCLGVLDVASKVNLPYKGEDFGQTLAQYKAPTGPYIVAPILGPTSLRDLTGKVVDFFIDPFKYAMKRSERNAINVAWLLHKRAGAKNVIKTIKSSIDPYETAKVLYIQNRVSLIND